MILTKKYCRCHDQLVRMVPSKKFGKDKYFCDVTGIKIDDYIIKKVKINLPDPDDTQDGSEVECPEDLEKAYDDYKKRAAGNGDD